MKLTELKERVDRLIQDAKCSGVDPEDMEVKSTGLNAEGKRPVLFLDKVEKGQLAGDSWGKFSFVDLKFVD